MTAPIPKRYAAAHKRDAQCVAAPFSMPCGPSFAVAVGAVWALVFVTQPMKQAPNDAAFIDLLKTLAIFLTGSLGGVLAGNGLKSKAKEKDTPPK